MYEDKQDLLEAFVAELDSLYWEGYAATLSEQDPATFQEQFETYKSCHHA